MSSKKYYHDLERCKEIAPVLAKQVTKFFGYHNGKEDLAKEFSKITSLKFMTCYNYIAESCRDGPCVVDCSDSMKKDTFKQKQYLQRVSYLFKLLNIFPEDPIVSKMEKVNKNFEYPPKECLIYIEFSDKNLSLTPNQINHLENLALRYAIQNKE